MTTSLNISYFFLFHFFHNVHNNKHATPTSTAFQIPLPSAILKNGWKRIANDIRHRPSFMFLLIALISQDSEAHHSSQPHQLVIAIWQRKQAEKQGCCNNEFQYIHWSIALNLAFIPIPIMKPHIPQNLVGSPDTFSLKGSNKLQNSFTTS